LLSKFEGRKFRNIDFVRRRSAGYIVDTFLLKCAPRPAMLSALAGDLVKTTLSAVGSNPSAVPIPSGNRRLFRCIGGHAVRLFRAPVDRTVRLERDRRLRWGIRVSSRQMVVIKRHDPVAFGDACVLLANQVKVGKLNVRRAFGAIRAISERAIVGPCAFAHIDLERPFCVVRHPAAATWEAAFFDCSAPRVLIMAGTGCCRI
jgi:hypothetical protein